MLGLAAEMLGDAALGLGLGDKLGLGLAALGLPLVPLGLALNDVIETLPEPTTPSKRLTKLANVGE